jgi:hypothetical protein
VPAPFDGTQIREKIDSPTQRLEWVSEVVDWERVMPGFDVPPILLDQRSKIRKDAPPVRHRAAAQHFRHRNWPADPRRQHFLTKKPGYPSGLRGIEGELVESGWHCPESRRRDGFASASEEEENGITDLKFTTVSHSSLPELQLQFISTHSCFAKPPVDLFRVL